MLLALIFAFMIVFCKLFIIQHIYFNTVKKLNLKFFKFNASNFVFEDVAFSVQSTIEIGVMVTHLMVRKCRFYIAISGKIYDSLSK